jgi:hypothetical protein
VAAITSDSEVIYGHALKILIVIKAMLNLTIDCLVRAAAPNPATLMSGNRLDPDGTDMSARHACASSRVTGIVNGGAFECWDTQD